MDRDLLKTRLEEVEDTVHIVLYEAERGDKAELKKQLQNLVEAAMAALKAVD